MILFLILLWANLFVQPNQTSQVDSLQRLAQESKQDSTKVKALLELAKYYYAFDQDSALYFTDQVIRIAEDKKNLSRLKGNALNISGVAYLIKSDFESALKTHIEALKLRESILDSAGMMESYLNIGNIHYRLAEPARAMENYKIALGIAEKIDHQRGMSLLFNNIGSFYLDRWLAGSAQEDYAEAASYLERSREIKESLGTNEDILQTLNQLAELYGKNGELEKSEKLLAQALEISKNSRDEEASIALLTRISEIQYEKGNINNAQKYATEAYQMSVETESAYLIADAAIRLSNLHADRGDYKSAYEYLQISRKNSDLIYNETRQKIRDDLAIQYQSEKKELDNQRLTQEQAFAALELTRKNQALVAALISALIFLVLLYFLRKNNIKLKKQSEQIKKQSIKLQESNAALSEANKFREKLFSIISHDLQSPFNGLKGSMELWGEGDLEKEEMDHILDLIKKDTQTASSMLQNLLNWARVQIASDQVVKEDLTLHGLVAENISLFLKDIQLKDLKVQNQVDPSLKLHSDRERLNFILRNLIKNAIKFTPKSGQIFIDAKADKIVIRDTGIGMNDQELIRLKNKNQYSRPGTEGEAGTGIGFMLSSEFAESLDAKITVESNPGEGSTFTILFN